MWVFFLDESGYSLGDWSSDKNLKEQPFHVLAAIAFEADKLQPLYEYIRTRIDGLNIDGVKGSMLGKGFEIKAKDVARGTGYWGKHEIERNQVRSIFLESVKLFDGAAFLSIVNKVAHSERYGNPADPTLISLEFIYERLERFLRASGDYGICIHDLNKKNQDEIQRTLTELNANGSSIIDYERMRIKHQDFNRLLENVFGYSEASLGLQIADFFATQTNTYLKEGRPKGSGWWNTIYSSLKTDFFGNPKGYGYKEFP